MALLDYIPRRMSSEEKEMEKLDGWIMEISDISCNKCNESDSTAFSGNAAEHFYSKGWRATENKCYCPKCAKKYLGKQKSKK